MAEKPDFRIRDIAFARRTQAAQKANEVFNRESDRGCLLVGGAVLDEVLRSLIEAFLIPDKNLCSEVMKGDGPLASFSSRIKLARLLGVITEDLFRDVDLVRRMRNEAAHFEWARKDGYDISFQTQSIVGRCRSLRSIPKEAWSSGIDERRGFIAFVSACADHLGEMALCAKYVHDNLNEHEPMWGTNLTRRMMFEIGHSRDIKRTIAGILGVDLHEPRPGNMDDGQGENVEHGTLGPVRQALKEFLERGRHDIDPLLAEAAHQRTQAAKASTRPRRSGGASPTDDLVSADNDQSGAGTPQRTHGDEE